MLPNSDHLELEQTGHALTVWFNEPENRNPLTGGRVEALIALCEALRDSDVRLVTFRGRGGVFCAGGDLKAFKSAFAGSASHDDIVRLSLQAADLFDAVAGLPQFTVMAVEGAAMAGGFGLTCCGDYVVADENARFALSEARIGLTPAQIAPFVLHRLGHRWGKRLMLTGEALGTATACEIGLVDQIVPVGDMDATLSELRTRMAKVAPGAIAAIKRQVAGLAQQARAQQRQAAAESFATAMLSNEAREGISAFFEKRNPIWAES